jgi:hypothetical protein
LLVPDHIYNIVETVLIIVCCHVKALAPIQEKSVSGIKVGKERVIVAPYSNAGGTPKLPLFLLVTSCKPRAFKSLSSLPFYCHPQKSSWINVTLC